MPRTRPAAQGALNAGKSQGLTPVCGPRVQRAMMRSATDARGGHSGREGIDVTTTIAGHYSAAELTDRYHLAGPWTARRELATATSVGAVQAVRCGRAWLLPEAELPAWERWLRQRGLLVAETPITAG